MLSEKLDLGPTRFGGAKEVAPWSRTGSAWCKGPLLLTLANKSRGTVLRMSERRAPRADCLRLRWDRLSPADAGCAHLL